MVQEMTYLINKLRLCITLSLRKESKLLLNFDESDSVKFARVYGNGLQQVLLNVLKGPHE